ncbi:hypothetical protein niasHT_030743 [Heterodera trifolii]|uniref:Uncharacterized protein n=1 Tax=Heterodera trifolii TaxID=157864 RepID=A0ABD2HNV2_9BILA
MCSSSAVFVLLQFAVVLSFFASANSLPAGQLRDIYSDPTRFFLPDALLADQLLSSAGTVRSFRPAAFVRPPLSPAKRYFDSLAGQSLGKRSSVAPRRVNIEDEMPQSDDAPQGGGGGTRRTMRYALRPGWQMW